MDAYSTHLEALVKTAMETKGGILELGCGDYSTPILAAIAKAQGREFKAQSSDREWAAKYDGVDVINWTEWEPPAGNWGMVFVDSEEGTGGRLNRLPVLAKITNTVVLHDAETAMKHKEWKDHSSHFKSIVLHEKYMPKTVVLRVDPCSQ